MKTRIEYDGAVYTVFVNDESVATFARYGDAERCLFAIIKADSLPRLDG